MHYGMVPIIDEKEKKKQQSFSRSFQIIIVKQLSNESVKISEQTEDIRGMSLQSSRLKHVLVLSVWKKIKRGASRVEHRKQKFKEDLNQVNRKRNIWSLRYIEWGRNFTPSSFREHKLHLANGVSSALFFRARKKWNELYLLVFRKCVACNVVGMFICRIYVWIWLQS